MSLAPNEQEMYTREDLRQLRLDGLPLLMPVLYTGAVGITFLPVGQSGTEAIWFGIALALLTVASYFAQQHSQRAAGILLVTGLGMAWAMALIQFPGEIVAGLAVLVVGVVSALFGSRAAIVAGIATSGIALFIGSDLSSTARFVAITSGGLGAFLFWLTSRPVAQPLEWAWSSYVDARGARDQLRQHQGELNAALKSLDLAYRRLEHLNNELARARHIADEARRLKSQFAANISHELRTPLNLIVGFSEMMVAMPRSYGVRGLPAVFRADVDAICRNAQHLSGLIDDVLDLSQIEAGRMGLLRERGSVDSVVEEAVRTVVTRLDNLGLTLTIEVPENLGIVSFDRVRIRQILINLINNAAKFTDRGGISVRAHRSVNEVIIAVSDTGVGIPADELEHVFDEFHQSRDTISRRVGGSGLGLTISRQLVELHGGSMWAQSEVGIGSTFAFSLPLSEQVVSGTMPGDWVIWDHVMRGQSPSTPALALVAPDKKIARTFQRYLDGYDVVQTETLDAARELATESPVRGIVVVSDTMEESWRVLSDVESTPKGDEASIPVAVCTVAAWESRATALGVAHYFSKPIHRAQLADVLNRLGRGVQTILIVDDDPDMVRLLARTVRSIARRYQVWQASGGAEALVVMRERRPDAVLLDLLMPDTDGYDVLKAMREDEQLSDVPVVVISARGTTADQPAVGMLSITRSGGLTSAEMMVTLKSCFDALMIPAHVETARRSNPREKPALAGVPPHRENGQVLPLEAPSR